MRALITGGTGFVGGHLRRHLELHGDEVVVTGHEEGPDLLDADGWAVLLASVAPDVVYHLAGDADVGGSWHHPRQTLRVNAEGTSVVLAACRGAGVGRVLVISSSDVYGAVRPEETPLRETAPVRPASPYAASKLAAEAVALQAWYGHGQEVVVSRSFNHLGPGQTPRFLAPALAERVARNEAARLEEVRVGNLSAVRDFTDVADVVRAYRLLVQEGRPGEVYNVCSGQGRSVQEIADALLTLARTPMRLVTDPDLLRPVDIPVLVGDHGKVTAATGWEPGVSLQDTLAAVLADWRTRLATP